MVDLQTVCCKCGDVGFPDKLFRCSKCHNRFQHSYCSDYYSESSEPIEQCDWCQIEEGSARNGSSWKKSPAGHKAGVASRSEYSGGKVKQRHDREEEGAEKRKNPSGGGAPSPRPTTRRYKLLKDVMC